MSEDTYWNDRPCEARRVTVVVADDERFPQYWAREFVGQERAAVEVWTPDGPAVMLENPDTGHFYIDDEDGQGWRKVTNGRGHSRYRHRSLAVERVVEARPSAAEPVADKPGAKPS